MAFAACEAVDADDRATVPVDTNQVEMALHYRFAPTVIRVPAGTPVTWSNADDFTHTVRFDGEGGGMGRETHKAAPGESFTITFDDPGEYAYTCSLHPHQMHGKVIVMAEDG